jgi:hypothetical protein
MPIAPSHNPPSITTTNSVSLSSALGVGRSLSAGRGGDGGDGLQQRNINLSPSGSSLDTSFSICNDQSASRRANHAGLLEEGLTLSPSTVVGGFTGAYNSLTGTPALFNFDWEATFDPLASTGNLYEPPNEPVKEAQQRLTPRQDLSVPLQIPPNSTASSNTTPTLDTAHTATIGASSAKQASPLVRTSTKRKADTEPAPTTQNWAVPLAREESRKRSQVGPGQSTSTTQNPRKWAPRPSSSTVGGSGSISETPTGNSVNHTRSNSLAVNNTTSSNNPGHSGVPASNITVRRTASEGDEANSGRTPSIMRTTRAQSFPEIPKILPHEKVFPVQIGCELFRLSGASISSDGQYLPVFCPHSVKRWLSRAKS